MKSFKQFLREDDFTYTTDQNKTDEHVKSFVSPYIDHPQIELSKNGVSVKGSLKPQHIKAFELNDDDTINVDIRLTEFVEGFVTNIVGKMISRDIVTIASSDFDCTTIPNGTRTQTIVKYSFRFNASKFTGQGTIVVSGFVHDQSIASPLIDFNCNWKETK